MTASDSNCLPAAARLAPVVALALVPKCGVCVIAWMAALAGLGVEVCGPSPSWTILGTVMARRLGLPVVDFEVLGLLVLALVAAVYFRLISRVGR